MEIRETGLLLAKIALIDNRTATNETIMAWHEILQDIAFEDAMLALLIHYRTSTDWVRPAHIVQGALAIRKERKKKIIE